MALGQKREKEESKNVEIFFWLTNSKGDLLLLLYEKKENNNKYKDYDRNSSNYSGSINIKNVDEFSVNKSS